MLKFNLRQWRYLLVIVVIVDLLIAGGGFYFFTVADSLAESVGMADTPTATATATPTPWPGPGPRPTRTPTVPPTPVATTILAPSGFPHGFTPTPRPTREPVVITLPQIYFPGRKKVDAPTLNQIYYPEPFFPPGTNNACGPVSLFAAFQGLNVKVDYARLRDLAVNNGFNAEGISKWGLINTALTLNDELGSPMKIEYGDHYRTRDLISHLRQGGVILVLVRIRPEHGRYRMTGETAGSIGHFLLVERINLRTGKVYLAGSTLGMDQVPVSEFLQSWTRNPHLVTPTRSWRTYLNNEPATNWALIMKRDAK